MSYLDLKETGPLVIKAPANVIGMFTDFFQKTITDVGAIGPDRARGGLYLLLPLIMRALCRRVITPLNHRLTMCFSSSEPSWAKATVNLTPSRRLKCRNDAHLSLWDVEKDVKPMQFPDASGKRVNMMYPTDASYWQKLKAFVDYEPLTAIPEETRSALLSIGIVKGKPFAPTAKQQEMLNKAVTTAPRMILARRQVGRDDQRQLYYKDRQWENSGRGNRRVDAVRNAGCQPACGILPDRLFQRRSYGYAYDRCRLKISLHIQRQYRQVPRWKQHLQVAFTTESTGSTVLGGHRLQYYRRYDA